MTLDPETKAKARAAGVLARRWLELLGQGLDAVDDVRPELEALPGAAGDAARRALRNLDSIRGQTNNVTTIVERTSARVAGVPLERRDITPKRKRLPK